MHAAHAACGGEHEGDPRVASAPPGLLIAAAARPHAMLANPTRPEAEAPVAIPRAGESAREAAVATAFIRYFDIVLVVAATPFVLLSSLPHAGFALAAPVWLATRVGVGYLDRRAWGSRNASVRTALHLASILGRVWFVALAVILARFALGNADGVEAAVVVLIAYTVELATKLVLRGPITAGLRRTP